MDGTGTTQSVIWQLKRLTGYVFGFVLFYAPFALFQRLLYCLMGMKYYPTIHSLCLRVPIEHLADWSFFEMGVPVIGTLLLSVVALFFGPFFCGILCPAGAFTEYLSRIVPDRLKADWGEYVPVLPVRYGFLCGFILTPLWGGYLACKYCNFYVFDLMVNYLFWGRIVALSSSLLLTAALWVVMLGLFTKGGRGYCTLFCPVGAWQSLLYASGRKMLPALPALRIGKECNSCGICLPHCPMNAMRKGGGQVVCEAHLCILCLNCINKCPRRALHYGLNRERGGAE